MPKVTVEGIEYNTEDMDEKSLAELKSVQFTEQKIQQLSNELAALQTARAAYIRKLSELLSE